jgi:hypothetical protein
VEEEKHIDLLDVEKLKQNVAKEVVLKENHLPILVLVRHGLLKIVEEAKIKEQLIAEKDT